MDRDHITKYERRRAILLKISLIISLCFVILAFRWTVHPTPLMMESLDIEEDESIPMVRTVHHKNKVLPPPVLQPLAEPVPEELDLEFTDEWVPEDPEANFAEALTEEYPDNNVERSSPPVVPPRPELPKDTEAPIPEFVIIAEEMPVFGDCRGNNLSKAERRKCSDRAILAYFAENIRYPPIARENRITGMVVIQFIVDPTGQVSNAKVVREIGGGCGKEALRVAMTMPRWRPGRQRGRPVRVQMNLPIRFELR